MGNYLTFDGISTADYGVEISGEGVFDAPARAYEMIEIPGRNGAFSIDQGRFENITVTYPAYNYETNMTDFAESLRDLRNALASRSGYCRLTDTFHPDEYRLGIFKSGLEVKPVKYNTASEFDLKFDCKPQRWLTSGETEKTLQAVFTNPTLFDAKPLIRIKGHGDVTLLSSPSAYKSKITFAPNATVENAGYSRYYDCELFEAYYIDSGGVIHSCNSDITITFGTPAFWGNETIAISTDSGISDYGFTPRWWRI